MTDTARNSSMLARFARSYWILGLTIRRERHGFRLRILSVIGIHAVFPLLAAAAGYFDDTWRLPGHGRGVLTHYGFQVLFVSAPIILWLAWRVVRSLAKVTAEPMPWLTPQALAKFTDLQRSLQNVALCRPAKLRGLLFLLRTVGISAAIVNASNTRYPEIVYGQDVFDSSRHALGYLAGRVFLAYYWVYLLPLVAYLAGAAIYAAYRTADYVDKLPDYEVRCFASDGCGGFKELGRLMTLIVYLWVPIVIVIIALKETHTNFYATLKLGAALAVIIPAQLFLPFVRLHRLLIRLKERKLAALERFLTNSEKAIEARRQSATRSPDDATVQRSIMPYLRLLAGESIYRHTVEMTTWPYLKSDVMRWFAPFLPIAISFAFKRFGLS